MSFDSIIDIEALVNPISVDSPTGSDIRQDRSPTSDYYAIKDARNNARAAERSSVFDENVDLITPWKTVVDIAPRILEQKSKDLEVASWYIEGLIRLHGFIGLRDGFKLINQLIENYWEDIYPEPDEDGLETKLAPFTGLNGQGSDGTLLAPMRNAPITDVGDFGGINFWQYQKARDNEKISDDVERNTRIATLGFSLKDIEDTVQSSTPEFCLSMVSTIEETMADYKSICNRLRELCANDAPPSSNISGLLDEILRSARFICKEKIESLQSNSETYDAEGNDVSADTESTTGNINRHTAIYSNPSGPITHREDALKRLQDVSDYFRLHEPHTPIGPGIERLILWGRMTVSELMMELLPEDSSRGIFSQLTGVKLDGSDTGSYVAPPAPLSPVKESKPLSPSVTSKTEETKESSETEAPTW